MIVGVVVVTHQGPNDMLRRCVSSIVDAGGATSVVVVDNSGSGLDASAVLGSCATSGATVEVVTSPNDGYGAALDVGLRHLIDVRHVDAMAVLNDDVVVTPGWLEPLVAELVADPGVGAVQPKMLRLGTDPTEIDSLGVRLDRWGAGSDIGDGQIDGPTFDEPTDISMFCGGAVLLRADFVADTGGFDPRYFLYYEDVDLALRGAELGWRHRCAPRSIVHHAASSTTSSAGSSIRLLQERNRLWIAFRFGSFRQVVDALWLSIRRLRHPPRRLHAKALLGGLAGAPRRLVERRHARRQLIG